MTTHLLIKKATTRMRRVVWSMLKHLWGDRLYGFRLPDGSRFEYPFSGAIAEHLFGGSFEPAEVAFVRGHLKPGDVVVDVGANAGLYTVIAARLVGETGHVYAFEPDQRAAELLRRNIAANRLGNVTVIEAAASNRTGVAQFAAARDTALSSLAEIQRDDQMIQEWRRVPTLRIDDAIERFGIRHVTFIKMDVEGAEKLVLEGAERLITGAAGPLTILLEGFDANTHAFGYTVHELIAALQAKHFTLQGFDSSQQLRPVEVLGPQIGKTVYNFVASRD